MVPLFLRRSLRIAAVTVASLGFATAPLRGQSAATPAAGNPEITELTLTGVHAVDPEELRLNIATDESHCASVLLRPVCLFSKSPTFYKRFTLNRAELARDMLRVMVFYFRRGYRDAQVDTSVVRTGRHEVHVTIAVNEGKPTIVSGIRIVQDTNVLRPRALNRALVLQQGRPY
ncbi:MAG TPA: POTRA domain-containing protein, partial [Gemmatimonadaceae bacterium]|nr:POTRA domain-containing protein [Gemmatimonadaceae bacterium]